MSTQPRNFSIRYLGIVLLCLIAGLGILGCGGGGSSSTTASGRYVGNFTTTTGQTGAAYLNVTSSGTITGTSVNTTEGNTTTLIGTITNTGATILASAGNTLTGTLTENSANQLTGTLTFSSGGGSITFTLNSVNAGTNPQYNGSLIGTFTTGGGDNGNLTLLVDGNGNVTGLYVDTTKNITSALTGSITNTGVLNLTPSTGGGSVTGTLVVGTSGQVTGTLNGPGGTVITASLVHS